MALPMMYVAYYQFGWTALAEGGSILVTSCTSLEHRTDISSNPYTKSSRSCLCLVTQLLQRTAEEHRYVMNMYRIMHLRSTALEVHL